MRFVKDYFKLTNNEMKGVTALLLFIFIVFVVPRVYLHFQEPKPADFSKFEELLSEMETTENSIENSKSVKRENVTIIDVVDYFEFNPNTVSKEELVSLGIKEKTAQTWINFVNGGAKFYKPEDIMKVYGISENDFNRLKPYIFIPTTQIKESTIHFEKEEKPKESVKKIPKPLMVDINQADTTELKSLKGIGSVYANRIVKFRNALGGFYSIEQLKEVYGFPIETYNAIESQLAVSGNVKQIKINEATNGYHFYKHPYINKEQGNLIFEKKEEFQTIEELKELNFFDEEEWSKIENYLTL